MGEEEFLAFHIDDPILTRTSIFCQKHYYKYKYVYFLPMGNGYIPHEYSPLYSLATLRLACIVTGSPGADCVNLSTPRTLCCERWASNIVRLLATTM